MEERQYRPTASPRPTTAIPTAPVVGPEPVRQSDRLAPQMGSLPTPPNAGPNGLMQLGQSLSSIVPGLDRLLQSYGEGVRKVEETEANVAAEQAARTAHIQTWADAVKENPGLASRSPYYRGIYEGRLARTAVQRQSNALLAEYFQSEVATSTDPNAIQGWLSERLNGTLEKFSGSQPALAAASDELRRQAEQLSNTHTQRAVRNLVERNEDSFNSAVGAVYDQAAQRGFSQEWVSGELTRLQNEARAQGLDGRAINRVLIAQTEEAMVRHGRPDLARVGSVPRPDGTPGFGTTAEGRQAFNRAADRIQSRNVQASNLAYTQLMRQRAEQERNAHKAVAAEIFSQMEDGRDPSVSPQTLRAVAEIDPPLAGKVMEMVNKARDFARSDDPVVAFALEAGLGQGSVNGTTIFSAFMDRRLSLSTAQRLYKQWETMSRDPMLNDQAVGRVIDEAQRLVGDPNQMGGIFRRPQEAAAISFQLRQSLIDFRKANPSATLGDAVSFLQQESEKLIPVYAPGMNLERLRLERVQQEGLPRGARQSNTGPAPAGPQPTARQSTSQRQPTAPVEATTIPPSPTVDWNRSPVFATRAELQSAYESFKQNPQDLTNPLTQWAIRGNVQNIPQFVQRQLTLIPATPPRQ